MVNVNSNVVQAFQLKEGKVNLDSGTHNVGKVIHCVADGDITIDWGNGNSDNIAMVAGEDYAINNLSVTINSGTFHID